MIDTTKIFYRVVTPAGEAPRCEAVEGGQLAYDGGWFSCEMFLEDTEGRRAACIGDSPSAAWGLALGQARTKIGDAEKAREEAVEQFSAIWDAAFADSIDISELLGARKENDDGK